MHNVIRLQILKNNLNLQEKSNFELFSLLKMVRRGFEHVLGA